MGSWRYCLDHVYWCEFCLAHFIRVGISAILGSFGVLLYVEWSTRKDWFLFYLGSDDYAVKVGATTHLNMNQDIELALRFTTGIKNGDEFFTDLNGFQVII